MSRGFNDGEYEDGELRGLTFLAGERGMGKTTEAIRLCEQCTGPVIFFDTVARHHELLPDYKIFTQPEELERYWRANRGRRVRVCYVPMDEYPERHMVEVSKIVRAFGWCIFAVDEIDTFCGQNHGPKGMPKELYYLAHFGRHVRVSMLATARDPASLSIRFRSQCEFMRLFCTTEDTYVDYFGRRIGKHNAEQLPLLPKTYFLLWRRGYRDAVVSGGPRQL